jgi:hypothetical protein
MADHNNTPYDPYIPSGNAAGGAAGTGNNRTAALQAVSKLFSLLEVSIEFALDTENDHLLSLLVSPPSSGQLNLAFLALPDRPPAISLPIYSPRSHGKCHTWPLRSHYLDWAIKEVEKRGPKYWCLIA